jgi:formylmethanofuran dehydrogenase subunit E
MGADTRRGIDAYRKKYNELCDVCGRKSQGRNASVEGQRVCFMCRKNPGWHLTVKRSWNKET